MGNIVIGIITIAAGIWMVAQGYYIHKHLLSANWYEQKFGPGTGPSFYRFLGLGIIAFGACVMFGMFDVYGSLTASRPEPVQNPNTNPSFDNREIVP